MTVIDFQPAQAPTRADLALLVEGTPHLDVSGLRAGYGKMEVLHDIDLLVGRGQSLCIIGPNGAGKSTILNALFGIATVSGGHVRVDGRDITHALPQNTLGEMKIAYVVQAGSVFPDMTVEENLYMGGYLLPSRRERALAVERVMDRCPQIAQKRTSPAGALSGGERRILEMHRALMTDPDILLVDEPSIGLEPNAIESIFVMLDRLQRGEGKTIVMVEQNAKKALEFADIGYVLVSGCVAMADQAKHLLDDGRVGRLFLGH